MHSDQVHDTIAAALEGHRLLTHPFYQRWEAGELSPAELAAYAAQYRHVERVLPTVLQALVARLPESAALDLVAATLADELGRPEPHATLFESFAAEAGARSDVAPTAATNALIDLHLEAATTDPVASLAMLAAYEAQAGDIAVSKADGLRRHYRFTPAGTRFWDVHADMESDHAAWSRDALSSLGAGPETVGPPAAAAARAWWAFLDDRELSAAAAA